MRLHTFPALTLGALLTTIPGVALADKPSGAPTKPATEDVTITIIPSGQDVMKTVVQNITVPAASTHPKPVKGKGSDQFGQQTAATARQKEENKESPVAEQHEATPVTGQDDEASEIAQQQAEEAAEHQATQAQQQAQQAQQQAQEERNKHQPPPPPPPPG